jgi:hypothetical protein
MCQLLVCMKLPLFVLAPYRKNSIILAEADNTIETTTLGIAFTIPETETAALETKTILERTTTGLNLLSKVEKVLQ